MTRTSVVAPHVADVTEHSDALLQVRLRPRTLDLFAAHQEARELGAKVGARMLVCTSVETVAGDIVDIDGGVFTLRLLAPLLETPRTITLRRSSLAS